MASAELRDELYCSICLSIYTDPVTLRCGHNFCRECINLVQDSQEEFGVFSCPECRAEFHERLPLLKNTTLSNIAEHFLSAQAQQEDTGIFCSYCINSSVPAVKSCLMCEASLCKNHLRVHSKSAEHILSDPTASLENRKCSVHKEVLKFYCTQDSVCICMSCRLAGEHRGHQVELLGEASKKRKETFKNVLHNLTAKTEETKHRMHSLQEHRREVQSKTAGLTERVTALFIDTKRQLEELEKRVLSEICREEEQALLLISEMIQQLEKEMDRLSGETQHIEELFNMSDPITILKNKVIDTDNFCDVRPENKDNDRVDKNINFDLIFTNLQLSLSNVVMYEKRGIYLQEASSILLDINTASNNVTLSDDLKVVSVSKTVQNLPKIPERFENYQVLSTIGFTSGKHYWDVEIGNGGSWIVGMAYTSIERKGDESFIGFNEKSWGLRFCDNKYSVRHKKCVTDISCSKPCHKFRIFLDYEAGQLSFYELSDVIRHLHTFSATFTEPLHAVFRVWGDCVIRILS